MLFIAQLSFAQTSIITETISKIEFEQDTVKAVFDWITDNIRYDVNKLYGKKPRSKSKRNKSYISEKERHDNLIKRVIQKKRGVCHDYSVLFTSILSELGIESYVVTGYSKNNDGKVNQGDGHAWNVAKVNGKWYLYDLTWGAGYVKDKKRFVKKYDPKWYKTDPAEMIKRHMPYDPMWQLLADPVSYEAFEDNDELVISKSNYDVEALVQNYLDKDRKEQMIEELSRSRSMGDGFKLIDKWRERQENKINRYGISNRYEELQETREIANQAIEVYNDYLKAKRRKSKSEKWTGDNAKEKLLQAQQQMESVIETFNSIKVDDKKSMKSISQNIVYYERLEEAIERELVYLKKKENRKRKKY